MMVHSADETLLRESLDAPCCVWQHIVIDAHLKWGISVDDDLILILGSLLVRQN